LQIVKRLRKPATLTLTLSCALLIGACSGGGKTPTAATAAAGTKSSVTSATIQGTPATTVAVGQTYSFSPTASAAAGETKTFSIAGKPSWASFNTSTGALTGSPTAAQVGSYPNIVIKVSAGSASASLTAFTITVTQASGGGSATLTWVAPTEDTDGSAIKGLAGFHIYYGTSESAMTPIIDVPSATTTTIAIEQLDAGTYYFAVAAYNAEGVESAQSNIGSQTI